MELRVSLERGARPRLIVSLHVAVLGGRWAVEKSMTFSVGEIGPLLGALTRAQRLVEGSETTTNVHRVVSEAAPQGSLPL